MGHAEDRIIEINSVGAIANYSPFVRAMGAVKATHHEPTSVILTPRPLDADQHPARQDDNPLGVPRAYAALDEFVSRFLPSEGGVGKNEDTAIVGDLSALTIGVRTDVTIEASRLGTGFKKGAVEVGATCAGVATSRGPTRSLASAASPAFPTSTTSRRGRPKAPAGAPRALAEGALGARRRPPRHRGSDHDRTPRRCRYCGRPIEQAPPAGRGSSATITTGALRPGDGRAGVQGAAAARRPWPTARHRAAAARAAR